jgi:hypothetical protein
MRVGTDYRPRRGDLLKSPSGRDHIVTQVAGKWGDEEISILAAPHDRFPGERTICKVSYVWGWEVLDRAQGRPKKGTIILP